MLATEANIHVSLVIHPRKVDITKTAQPADLLIESVGGSPKSTQVHWHLFAHSGIFGVSSRVAAGSG